jgi:hypothetical protein
MILASVLTFLILLIIPIFSRPVLTLGAFLTKGEKGIDELSTAGNEISKPNLKFRKGLIIFYLILFSGSIIWMIFAFSGGLGKLALFIILMILGFSTYFYVVSIPSMRHINETRKKFPRPSPGTPIGEIIDWENKVHDENMSYKIPMKYYAKVTIPFILWNVILIIVMLIFAK